MKKEREECRRSTEEMARGDWSDEALLSGAKNHPEYLEALYNRWAARLTTVIRAAGVPGDQLADVLQIAFLEIWRHLDRFDARRGTAQAWMFQIVRYRTIDYLRRQGPLPVALDEGRMVEASAPDPLARIMVESGLLVLTERERRLITLLYHGGYTQQEISKLWNVPLGTVKTWSHRALGKMRRHLEGTGREKRSTPP